jgi:hypothetical protein
MSRRCHHGSPRHARSIGPERRRPAISERATTIERAPAIERAPTIERAPAIEQAPAIARAPVEPSIRPARPAAPAPERLAEPKLPDLIEPGPPRVQASLDEPPQLTAPRATMRPRSTLPAVTHHREPARSIEAVASNQPGDVGSMEHGATAPQLRRFIKSRAYVPMHELRRRFAINGGDDDVTAVDIDRQRVFVGLPEREGRLLGELLRGGDIGYELSLDPISPIVVGVYPMRPVTRA